MLTAVAWMSRDIAKSSLGLPAAEFRHTSLLPCRVATAPCKQHVLMRTKSKSVKLYRLQQEHGNAKVKLGT